MVNISVSDSQMYIVVHISDAHVSMVHLQS